MAGISNFCPKIMSYAYLLNQFKLDSNAVFHGINGYLNPISLTYEKGLVISGRILVVVVIVHSPTLSFLFSAEKLR
jgi:hypothetical protein